MSEEQIMQLIKNKSKREIMFSELVNAKFVSVRGDKHCRDCGIIIPKSTRALTASYYIDKMKNKTYREIAKSNRYLYGFRFVLTRHYLCTECAIKRVLENSFKQYSGLDELDKLNEAYDNGEISGKEYQTAYDAILANLALQDAVGIGQS